jgi:Flp pilus assembly protein TadG
MRLMRPIRLVADRLIAERRGAAAVEFALLLPLMALLYLGLVEVTQGAMAEQRVAHTASAIGDLVAQSSTVTSAEVGDIFAVGDTVMSPYPATGLQMRISSLTADKNGAVTVAWSQARGMSALTKSAAAPSLPTNVVAANESVIMGESSYAYQSVFGMVLPQPIVFRQTYYLHPRLSTRVTCADC